MRVYKSKLATALTSVLILAGCGGGGSSTPPSTVTVTSTPPTPAPVTPVNTPADDTPATDTTTTTETEPPPQNILEAVSQSPMPSANTSENNSSTINLTGVAAKGVLPNTNIVVFDPFLPPEDITDEDEGLLGSGVTNADGEFSISVQTNEDTGEFLAVAALFEGATMICDAPSGCIGGASFGEPVALSALEENGVNALFSIFPKPAPGTDAVANLNLFTHMQLFRMLGIALETPRETPEGEESAPVTLEAQHVEPAFNFIVNAFQLESEPFHTVPFVDVTRPIESTNQNAVNMALLSAGFLEAGTQAQLESRGDDAVIHDVFDLVFGPTLLRQIFTLNERDAENNPRLMSLEDIFEAGLKTAELNTAQNNATSLAIDLLNQQNAAIDALPFDGRLDADGNYPDPQDPVEAVEAAQAAAEEAQAQAEADAAEAAQAAAEEAQAEAEAAAQAAAEAQEQTQADTNTEFCRPDLSPNTSDEIVLLSGYEGTAYSSVAVSSLNEETEVTRVRIEAGVTPLYIIASTFTDMVWSIEGDTDRVAGFVAAKGRNPGFAGAGVVGLSEEKVDFIDNSCMEYFTSTSASAARRAITQFESIFDREIDRVISEYTLSSVAIPSGEMISRNERQANEAIAIEAGQDQITADNGITFNIESQTQFADQTQLFRFTQEGLATVPVSQVVSPGEVQTYDVFPAEAGLIQLISSGHIEFRDDDNSQYHQNAYFIHETFPRFPAGLTGAHAVRFILGTGVALPGGSAGHSSVRSEETGECLITVIGTC